MNAGGRIIKKLLMINEMCSWLQTFRPSDPGGTQAWITVLPANIPCLSFHRNCWPDGVTSNWSIRHPVAAYYSSIDPKGMKGW